MTHKNVRILIVDDHAVVRMGYRMLLMKCEGFEVVEEAGDAAAAYRCYKNTHPDVVIMDISMPGRGGIDAAEQILRLDPHSRILIFTMHSELVYALHAFRVGAVGYVTKSSPPDLLISAVHDIANGKKVICPEVSEALALNRLQPDNILLEELSPREFEVLRMMLDKRSAGEIASALNVSRKTVSNYHYNIKSKLGLSSDIELAYFGMQQGMADPIRGAHSSLPCENGRV